MAYLGNESKYKDLMGRFVQGVMSGDEFSAVYMEQWKVDRDEQWAAIDADQATTKAEAVLCNLLDEAFTACDCYAPYPEGKFQISADQLRLEIAALYEARWGLPAGSNNSLKGMA